MALPAPPGPDTSAPDDPNAVQNVIPSVHRTAFENIANAVGSRGLGVAAQISGTPQEDFSQTTIGKLLGEHYQQRLNDARRHYQNARTYEEILNTGTNPDTGDPLSDGERSQYQGMKEGAWNDYIKAAGVNPQAKEILNQRKEMADSVHQHGLANVHGALTGLGLLGNGESGDKSQGQIGGTAAPPALATPESLGIGKTGIPAPPPSPYNEEAQLGAPQAAGAATTAVGQVNTGQATRKMIANRIGLAPKPGETPSTEYQRFMATGQMPASVSLQLLGDRVPGKNVPQSAVTTDGSIVDPSGFYRLQREPYSGMIIATAASATPGQITPKQIKYKGPGGQDLFGTFIPGVTGDTGKLYDQSGQPLPPGTEAFDASLAPTTSATTAPHYTVDQNGNVQVNIGTSVTSRTRGLPPLPENAPEQAAPPSKPATPATKPVASAPATPKAGVSASTPLLGPDGEALHKPLSAPAKQSIGQATISLDLIDKIMPDLDAIVKDAYARGGDPNSIFKSAEERSAWEQYMKGIDPANVSPESLLSSLPNVDPRLAKIFPAMAMLQIVGAQPWLRNIRRFEFLQQVQQHIPDPAKDTPKLMETKLDTLANNLPNLIRAAYEEEGIEPKPYRHATIKDVQDYVDAAKKAGTVIDYADAAHMFRRRGFKVSRE